MPETPDMHDMQSWPKKIRQRFEGYLRTSFFFKDPQLRASFQAALAEGDLLKGPFTEDARDFERGISAPDLARECFPQAPDEILPALMEAKLHSHQERAIRAAHCGSQNVVVATGTASGKTESFLYPILFDLYREHLAGELDQPGVRALILYPMNALANDQRERLRKICKQLQEANSGFRPTFGQYIGQTPEDRNDKRRNADWWTEHRLADYELVFRKEMRKTPPHILLTNYSMLEYLLIRPMDSNLFDEGRSEHWKFIVLDEAHQYRGAKGMEMGMLIRRLKQRLRDGGREASFRCIATSATLSAGEGAAAQRAVAEFATELFGEQFSEEGIVFGTSHAKSAGAAPRRYHAFLRALEGAFLVHRDGKDAVVLNRTIGATHASSAVPLELALCRECGQHYYVGREREGKLQEAVRDPSHLDFGVDYYLPDEDGQLVLCRACGKLSPGSPACDCEAGLRVIKCPNPSDELKSDQLRQCEACGYRRGGIGDPVQEIVHGSDGPNAVIATALHELLPPSGKRVLAFADSRQEAAFFAWYAQDSYEKLRDRNLIMQAINRESVGRKGLSIDDLANRLIREWQERGLFKEVATDETRKRRVLTAVLREALTDEKRLSLAGVGLVEWFVQTPDALQLPRSMQRPPWNLTENESRCLVAYLLDALRHRYAMNLPAGAATPPWLEVAPSRSQIAYKRGKPGKQQNVKQWGAPASAAALFLNRLLERGDVPENRRREETQGLMEAIWDALRRLNGNSVLVRGSVNGSFQLNSDWLRIRPANPEDTWECGTCATVAYHNIRSVCPRHRCPGILHAADQKRLTENHYRRLYAKHDLPPVLIAEEHTAQIDSAEARKRQSDFKKGEIHLLSSSTTFEVGVDLGELDVVFLRNVPPEPFNYTQRVGRAGRRGDKPGLALTYCRRNPHDLYHYEDPRRTVIAGEVQSPRLRMTNEKIILRHMMAAALSSFFRRNRERFKRVSDFVGDWQAPHATSDLRAFCERDAGLAETLREIVPERMHERTGLASCDWIERIAGPCSRLAEVEAEVCSDWLDMESYKEELIARDRSTGPVERRRRAIKEELTLSFLSRKAVIPKYGFPVDVVELDTRRESGTPTGVSLQRDLSQAIAEYAPGGKVVARKQEWESCGVKVVPDKALPVRHYTYSNALDFRQWSEGAAEVPHDAREYLIPTFGFVTPLDKKSKEPTGRARRLYTTRPFFRGFEGSDEVAQPEEKTLAGVRATKAQPGTLVVLCEGRNRRGFYICLSCGAHDTRRKSNHKSPAGRDCQGKWKRLSLGHELVTDVLRLRFPGRLGEWEAYSVAYAVLLGSAARLHVPNTDLNVTITGGAHADSGAAIVLYDNVPGGAGLVEQLEDEVLFRAVLKTASERVAGPCGCDSSCYGCLRSYRNQFAHPHLNRCKAREVLEAVLA